MSNESLKTKHSIIILTEYYEILALFKLLRLFEIINKIIIQFNIM